MQAQTNWDIRNSRPAEVLIAFLAILALVVAVAPAATTEEPNTQRLFRFDMYQNVDAKTPNRVTEANPVLLGPSDGGTGRGDLNLHYFYTFTCNGPVNSCAGATITTDIPEVAYNYHTDKLLQAITNAGAQFFDMKVDEAAKKLTLTVKDGWAGQTASSYISVPTSAHSSIPGEENLIAMAEFGGEEIAVEVPTWTKGEYNPTLSKSVTPSTPATVKPGDFLSFSLAANRAKTAGTQTGYGEIVDVLPEGYTFMGFTTWTSRPNPIAGQPRLSVVPTYDEATRTIRVQIPRDYAAYFVRERNLGATYIVRVDDVVEDKARLVNTATYNSVSIDGKTESTLSRSVTRTMDKSSGGGAGNTFNKVRHGVNEPYTENLTDKNYEINAKIRTPRNDEDPTITKIIDVPKPWDGDNRVPFMTRSIELYSFPLDYEDYVEGQAPVRKFPAASVRYFYEDGTEADGVRATAGERIVFTNPKYDPNGVRVVRTEMTLTNVNVGDYKIVVRGQGQINPRTPSDYMVVNAGEMTVNGNRIKADTNPKCDEYTSCAEIEVKTLSPDPFVWIRDTTGNRVSFAAAEAASETLQRLDPAHPTGVRVAFGLFNNSAEAGASRPTVYLTAPTGLRFVINDDANPPLWSNGTTAKPDRNAQCAIEPSDWVFEEAGESPSGGQRVRVTLDPEKFPDGFLSNTGPAEGINCMSSLRVVRDRNTPLLGGSHSNPDLTNPMTGLAITVVEENQAGYLQSDEEGQRDVYGVVPSEDIPEGTVGAPKINQEQFTFNIPSVEASNVVKSVRGDRDFINGDGWKTQLDWQQFRGEFATEADPTEGFWDSEQRRDAHLSLAESYADFRISAGTEGTMPLEAATVYDFLPNNDNNDRGKYTGSSFEKGLILNNGQFPENGMIPTLAGPVTPTTLNPEDVTIEYSDSINPCRPRLTDLDSAGCVDDWTTTPDNYADVKVIRITFNIVVDRMHDFEYRMNMPPTPIRENDGLRRSDIAYNNVAMVSTPQGSEKSLEPLGPFAAAIRFVPAVRIDKQIEIDGKGTDTADAQNLPIFVEGDEINYRLHADNASELYVADDVRVVDYLPKHVDFERAELINEDGTVVRELTADEFKQTEDRGDYYEYTWYIGDLKAGDTLHLRVVAKVKHSDSEDDFIQVPNLARIMTRDDWVNYDGIVDTRCQVNVGFEDDCDRVESIIDLRKGSISGTYFRDVQDAGVENSNILDAADERMAGQKVILNADWAEGKPYPFINEDGTPQRNADGSIKTRIETVTDQNGNYVFTDLVNGDYWVEFETRENLPFVEATIGSNPLVDSDAAENIGGSDLRKRTAPIKLGVGENLPGNNAGVRGEAATIKGTFWFDKDEDGVVQAAEGEVVADQTLTGGSATVELWKDGKLFDTQTTSDGTYSFPGLDAGNYEVRVTNLPNGWRITENPVGKNGNLVEAEVTDNTVGRSGTIELDWGMTTDRDVPIVNTASLAGVVYREDDRDGRVAETAPTVPGAIVYLLDETGERVVRNGMAVTVVTGEDGAYKFAKLAPGTYGVEIVPPAGYVLSAQAGTLENLDAAHLSDVEPATGKLTGIELSGSENQVNVDAVVNDRLTISGVVVNDANADGLFDEGEGRYANIQVYLSDENGERIEGIEPVQTDVSGAYSFVDIPAREGGYKVEFVKPQGTVFSPVKTGENITVEGQNDADAEGLTTLITAVAGQDKPNVDAYINNLGAISGHFYLESDTNGIVQAGDPKINTVRVSTMVGEDEVFATVNEDGTFIFEGLPAGNYDLKFTVPSGYRISATTGSEQNLTDGLRNDVSAGGTVTGVPVTAGNTTENVDLVVHPIGSVAGTVFIEGDKDGDITTNSNGNTLAGVTVELRNAQGTKVGEAVTDFEGNYRFDNVVEGAGYTVVITDLPEGYNLSALAGDANEISAENLNDFTPATKTTASFVVTGGQTVDNVDAVVHQFGGVSGRIVIEENTDGRIDDNETVAGASVTVRLLDSEGNPVTDVNGVAITTQTDENGNYSFAGLPAGEYQVVFDMPMALRFSPTTGGEDVTAPNLNDFTVGEGNVAITTVTVNVNQITNNVDAIMHGVGGVSGRMVALPNDSGIVTENVIPVLLGGQTVTLKLEDGDELTTTTNDDGTYVFENVPAGDHTVVFPTVTGHTFSNKTGGDDVNEANLNDADPESREISVTVPRDGQVVNADAILHGDTSISGIYFNDFDNDGTRDTGEDTIEGVRVELLDAGGKVIASTTTGANGGYKFDHLVGEQDYQVRFITPRGMAISPVPSEATDSTNDAAAESGRTDASRTQTVRPTSGTPVTNLNGAATGTALLAGTVFNDANRDGIFDEDESGRAGIIVRLLDKNGNPVEVGGEAATSTTDADGTYSFRVPAGEYRIEVVAPENEAIAKKNEEAGAISEPGYSDVVSTTGRTAVITAAAGQAVNTIDAGIVLIYASISGTVYGERDEDGDVTDVDEASVPVPGATVELIDESGTVVDTVRTNAQGAYVFGDQRPGKYTIRMALPSGWAFSAKAANSLEVEKKSYIGDVSEDTEARVQTGTIAQFELLTNSDRVNIDAVAHSRANVSGTFFDDVDGDGRRGENEGPRAGVTVELVDAEGAVVETTTTDREGNYTFTNVFPGEYTVRFDITDDEDNVITPENPEEAIAGGTNNADTGANPRVGSTKPFTVEPGNSVAGVDAASTANPGSITGTVWVDADRDRGIGNDEPERIGGVTVELVSGDQVVATAVTDEQGNYQFGSVTPGDYTVRVAGENPALDGREVTTETSAHVTVNSGKSTEDINFGYVTPVGAEPGSVSGVIWNDANRDGRIGGADEGRLEGIKVELVDDSGDVIATASTDTDGGYRFSEVEAGTYTIRVVPPAGFEQTSDPVNGTTNPVAGVEVTVEQSQNVTAQDFGFVKPVVPTTSSEPSTVTVTTTVEAPVEPTPTTEPSQEPTTEPTQSTDPVTVTVTTTVEPSQEPVPSEDPVEPSQEPVPSEEPVQPVEPEDPAPLPGSVSGTVWIDADRNKDLDDSEAGRIQSVVIELRDDAGKVVARTATDEFGNYTFGNVAEGEYSVAVAANNPALSPFEATTEASRSVNVAAGEEAVGNNFGYANPVVEPAPEPEPNPASIAGTVWIDSNEDQLIGDDEAARIGSVVVELYDTEGNFVAQTLTDASGNYTFNDLEPGDYQVRIAENEDNQLVLGEYTDTTGTVMDVTVDEGDIGTADFGYISPAPELDPIEPADPPALTGGVSGTVWRDEDHDGLVGVEEELIADALVRLYDQDGNLIAETHTDEDGHYEFGDIEPGKYLVRVYGNDETGSLNSTTVGEYEIEVLPEEINAENNFGFAIKEEQGSEEVPEPSEVVEPKKLGAVSGIIFNDVDRDGVIDSGEYGVSGVVVELLDETGAKVADATTDEHGRYKFDNVAEGTYQIRVVNLADYEQTYDAQRGTTSPENIITVEVEEGENLDSQNFGYVIEEEPTPGPVEGSSNLELKEILPWAAIALVPIAGAALADIGGRLPGMPAPTVPTSPAHPTTSVPSATTTPAPAPSGSSSAGSTGTAGSASSAGTGSTGSGSSNSARSTTSNSSSGSVARTLADTGASVIGLLVLAAILMLVGIMLVVRGNRRQED